MTKTPVPLRVDDLTVFTRTLSAQLGSTSPSHLSLMNMVARAAGFQNVQHMRATTAAAKRLAAQPESAVAVDARAVERALHQFDAKGRLRQWPAKQTTQTLSLWATLPAHRVLDAPDLSAHLAQEHLFDDPATLRRTMISCGLLTRNANGSAYQRVEQEPPTEAKAVIHAISRRRRQRSA